MSEWQLALVVPPKSKEVEAFIYHRDTLDLNLPGIAVITDANADDLGPQGVVDYLNALEARATTAEVWQNVVLDALVNIWELNDANTDDPRKAVADLLAANQRWALDPAISEDAAKLRDTYLERATATEAERDDLLDFHKGGGIEAAYRIYSAARKEARDLEAEMRHAAGRNADLLASIAALTDELAAVKAERDLMVVFMDDAGGEGLRLLTAANEDAARLAEELFEMVNQYGDEGKEVGWQKRLHEAVRAALAAHLGPRRR